MFYNFFLIAGMLGTVHSVDTATFGGLGGIHLYVFSTATSFKESLFFLLRFDSFIITNIFHNLISNCRHERDCTFCWYCYLRWSWWYPLYVFSTATSFKESLFFLLRFEPFIIQNKFYYNFIFNCRHDRDCTSCGYCYLWWSWWYSSLCLLYNYFQKITHLTQVCSNQ